MKVTIRLSRSRYENKTFEYNSLSEGRKGFKRLFKSCTTQFLNDYADRQLELIGSNGLIYRSAQVSKVYIQDTILGSGKRK